MKVLNRFLLPVGMAFILSSCHIFAPKNQEITQKPVNSSISASSQATVEVPSPTEYDSGQTSKSNYDNIWGRIRAGYGLPSVSDNQVSTYLHWYSRNQNYVNRFSTQAVPYLYYVVSEMEANNMPLELALIPVIESAYNPHVSSPSNTVGIWQFVPETGRNFGLKQNAWYNGRKDVIASTDAAIRYLKRLHADFDGDWLLVVAAYNAGEGTVNNAIEKNKRAGKATDFWSLPLPKHTQTYIPRLLALSKIIANPQRYNLTLKAIPDTPYFVKINVDKQINLAQVAKQANMDAGELKKLNSGINGWLTSPSGGYQVLVPVEDAAAFTLQLNSLPKITFPQAQEYIAKKGDTLASVAKAYGSDADTIAAVNNLKKTQLHAGQHLQIPLASPSSNNLEAKPTNTTTDTAKTVSSKKKKEKQELPYKENKTYYTVKSGENLWVIAKAQNISVKTLAKINDLSPTSILKPGQKLLLLSQTANSSND